MEGHGEQRNLDDFVVVSLGILQTGPQNLAKFFMENWALIIWPCLACLDYVFLPSGLSQLSTICVSVRILEVH